MKTGSLALTHTETIAPKRSILNEETFEFETQKRWANRKACGRKS
ncbi:hypothetical protein CHCC14820_0798 [Bacillus paralicheniformis]|uniref:Uncharacterized protein n=1 Tax=Bacillus paralicheniformis TaxID=1648923 RepID=A0ABY3FNT1_9BACI|nr:MULTISPECIES: hypothetical protein [Bacillus]MCQ5456462.1 hypothetical protein [Bacillus paralicheniformis]MDE1384297.1 hypothetical protein [Bacillus paralicheniformis]MDE1392891.1 hypothetical protein [Bacillus paralicheniformis]MDU0414008.1 hypothetical protein [Bacillus paralicheniformis]MEC2172921.1 hypothetical protein [Bacillus paralicheniformis]